MLRKWIVAACLCLTLAVVAACGDEDDDEGTTAATAAAEATSAAAETSAPAETTEATAEETEATEATEATEGSEETTEEPPAENTFPLSVAEGEGLDLSGKKVTINGTEVGVEADGFTASFEALEERTGVDIQFSGSRDFETQISLAIEAGQTPDIGIFPQPGKIRDHAEDLPGVPDDVKAMVENNFDPYWAELVTRDDGKLLAVPNKADLKSLVWYSPSSFEENGWTVPETWEDFMALQQTILDAGKTPWCIGLESGDATGWPFTDWVEDFMLRMHGPDVYDQWVAHEIPFNDPKVKEVVQAVSDIWFKEGNVLQSRGEMVTTAFPDAGLPLLDGDCELHRQGNFYAANLEEAGAQIGPDGDVNAFYLPPMNDQFGIPVLGGGGYAVPFNDKPETIATIKYLASPEYVNNRILARAGGFMSANKYHDVSTYETDIERTFAEILVSSDPFRFDASDLMPGAVGAGSFWKLGTDYVSGAIDIDEMLDGIEASWPQ
jgi:alpha-glucoside transport system substrate-binding protein